MVAVLALTVAGAAAAAPSGARQATPPVPVTDPVWIARFVELVNGFRAQHGLPPLVHSVVLDQLGREHSLDMLTRGYLAHTAPDGTTFEQRVSKLFDAEGWVNWDATENLAALPGRPSPEEVFAGLLNDPEHTANFLGTKTPYIGVGLAYADEAPGIYEPFGPITAVSTEQGPPEPVLGKSVLGSVVSGVVRIRPPGSSTFVLLTKPQLLLIGTEIDTTRGRIRIASVADEIGHIQIAQFYDGRFIVTYVNLAPAGSPTSYVTDLRLSAPLACGAKRTKRSLQEAAAKPKKRRSPTRSLWGNGVGKFRTRGAYASATVRGTIWLVRDTCTTTQVVVRRGVVEVFDVRLGRTVIVRAGQSYTTKPRRRSLLRSSAT